MNQLSSLADRLGLELGKFGLEKDQAYLYIALLEYGIKTPLELSRMLKMPRTKVYRILEKLLDLGFVKEKLVGYGKAFEAESYDKFNIVISEFEGRLEELKASAPLIFNIISEINLKKKNESKILHYRGVEGLKQVTWNSLSAEGLLRIFELSDMNAFLDKKFAEKVRLEFARRKIRVHQLTNQKVLSDSTDIEEHIKYWTPRYLDPKKMKIDFEVLIYNDVYCMYEYRDHDIFIVEIHNEKLAKMQKGIFDLIWDSSKKMRIIGNKGRAVLES